MKQIIVFMDGTTECNIFLRRQDICVHQILTAGGGNKHSSHHYITVVYSQVQQGS